MTLQFQVAPKEGQDTLTVEAEKAPVDQKSLIELLDDAFMSPQYTRAVYAQLDQEYNARISPKFSHITKAKSQFPPYWNDEKNRPEELPLYQHNVNSGRYQHAVTQLSLTYNSFFPNESYSKSLIELKVVKNPFGPDTTQKPANKAPKDLHYTPEPDQNQQPATDTDQRLSDLSNVVEQAYNNLLKNEPWAKAEHLKMVSDLMHYGAGMYFYEDPKSYKFKAIDYRKVRFPSGTTINPDEWEYLFIQHEMTVSDLVKKYKGVKNKPESDEGWNKVALSELLNHLISANRATTSQPNTVNPISIDTKIDNIREGYAGLDWGKLAPATINVVSCYWKQENGKIGVATFNVNTSAALDRFLFVETDHADSFGDVFSFFPADETENEIRMIRGWGEKIHPLCHAYDRSFCKFLDHLDYSATLFLNMDPNDVHKKILHFGSINIGKIDSVQNFPSALQPIIAALALLDSKIDAVTFTRGLNKTELMGEGRGAELASIVLTVEGRIHKHLNSRFAEHLTVHYRRNLSKVIRIALKSGTVPMMDYPAVKIRFLEYLKFYNFGAKDIQLDDTSNLNYNLPSNWIVVARKPDTSGIGNSTSHVVELLRPFFSSLPEDGFRYMLARIISDAFGDEDMIQRLLPDANFSKTSAEADTQIAETQTAILTSQTSDFDKQLTPEDQVDPNLSDAHKFVTLPASRQNDHVVFLQVFLAKCDDAVQRMNRNEFGRTTLHIWLYNLVSSAQAHVQLLRQDQVRGARPDAQQLFKRFGNAFNLLRQVESQANSERQKKFDALQQQIAKMKQDSPEMITAQAKLEEARAKQADVALKYRANDMQQFLATQENRRAEEAHIVDQGLKTAQRASIFADIAGQINQSPDQMSQGDVGRPDSNFQGAGGSPNGSAA